MSTEECAFIQEIQPDYYKYGSDNSPGCYLTNYILAACIVIYMGFLYYYSQADDDEEHEKTRRFVIAKYGALGLSVLTAGFVHEGIGGARGGNLDDHLNGALLWPLSEICLVLAGSCTVCAALASLTRDDNSQFNLAAYALAGVAGGGMCVWVAFTDDSFAIAGAFGELVPNFLLLCALVVACLPQYSRLDHRGSIGARVSIAGIVSIKVGAVIQFTLGPSCGVACPVDCPLPAPVFNHNALFHLIQAFGMGLLAVGMNLVCKCMETVDRTEEMKLPS